MRVAVIGGGAAGITAAIFAASNGAKVVLLERTGDGGRKIVISGGGRCNILPRELDEARFVTDSSRHIVRNVLRSWPLREQIVFFEEEASIPLITEDESGKLFPRSESGRDVRDRLFALARDRGVTIRFHAHVKRLAPRDHTWLVELDQDTPVQADAVVVATGGLSVPATGSDGFGLAAAADLGHTVHQTYAALTPILGGFQGSEQLSGVSLRARMTATAGSFQASSAGGFLFTHRGYSGPAVLDVSHVITRSRANGSDAARLTVAWGDVGERDWEDALKPSGTKTVHTAISRYIPNRAAAALLLNAGLDPSTPLAHLKRDDRRRVIDALIRGDLPWTGDDGYKKAEVTGGGVALDEVNAATMESRIHPGLYLCGEMLDAFGPIGGYNFFWAWATGRAAGMNAALR